MINIDVLRGLRSRLAMQPQGTITGASRAPRRVPWFWKRWSSAEAETAREWMWTQWRGILRRSRMTYSRFCRSARRGSDVQGGLPPDRIGPRINRAGTMRSIFRDWTARSRDTSLEGSRRGNQRGKLSMVWMALTVNKTRVLFFRRNGNEIFYVAPGEIDVFRNPFLLQIHTG